MSIAINCCAIFLLAVSGTLELLDDFVPIKESVAVSRQKESDSDSEVEVTTDHEAAVNEAALSEADATNKDSNYEDSSASEMDDMFDWLVIGEDPNDMVEEEPVIFDTSFVWLH
jgi:hypothetical protein